MLKHILIPTRAELLNSIQLKQLGNVLSKYLKTLLHLNVFSDFQPMHPQKHKKIQ